MSDANLLAFGCAVSFVAAAGAYVYVRECFTEGKAVESDAPAEKSRDDLRNVA